MNSKIAVLNKWIGQGSSISVSILFSILWATPSMAENPESIPFREFQDEMRQEGQILSVRLSSGDPMRIFVVGKEEAKFDFSKLELTVRRIKPYPGKLLKLDRYNNYFAVSDSEQLKKNATLEISAKIDNKTEKFRFKIKNKIP